MKIKVKVSVKQFMNLARYLKPRRFTSNDADILEDLAWLIREEVYFLDVSLVIKRLKAKLAELQIYELDRTKRFDNANP